MSGMDVFYLHAGAMVLGFLFMSAGVGIARFQRRKRWWLKAHKTAGSAGPAVMLFGLAAAFLMVEDAGSGHIQVPHAAIGLVTMLLALLTPLLGHLPFRIPQKARALREKHRWSGRVTLAVGSITILSGLYISGII